MTPTRLLIALLLPTLVGACKGGTEGAAPSAQQAPAATPDTKLAEAQVRGTAGDQEAQAIFVQRCVMCHGPQGHGDGVASAALNPKPQNYSDPAWQKATADAEIAKAIVKGGASVGKSAMMPANPDLEDKPQVVEGLVQIVRSFGRS